MSEKKLVLYIRPTCPYCRKVLNFIEQKGLQLETVDITSDGDAQRLLMEKGGKTQVPCLFIDGEPMYESSDIIQYLAG